MYTDPHGEVTICKINYIKIMQISFNNLQGSCLSWCIQ